LELGVDPDDARSSRQAAVVSFFSFSLGAVLHYSVVLHEWATAVVLSVAIGAIAAFALGAAIGSFSAQGVWRTASRQLAAAAVAASVTYAVGRLIGTRSS